MWFCNVLGLCSGSFSEGRERLSTQGFHLCITTRVCCLSPPSCTGIRAPPADVGLFRAILGTRCVVWPQGCCGVSWGSLCLPASCSCAHLPVRGGPWGDPPLLHVPKDGGMSPGHISSKGIYKCLCGHWASSEPLAWGTWHSSLSCPLPQGCPAPQGCYCPGGQHWGGGTKLLLEG